MDELTPKKIIKGFLPFVIILLISIPIILFKEQDWSVNKEIALFLVIAFLIFIILISLPFFIKSLSIRYIKITWFYVLPLLFTFPALRYNLKITIWIFIITFVLSPIINYFSLKYKFESIKKHESNLIKVGLITYVINYIIVQIIISSIQIWLGQPYLIRDYAMFLFPILLTQGITFNIILIIQGRYNEFYEHIDEFLKEKRSL